MRNFSLVPRKRRLGIDLQMPAEIDQRKQHVAELVLRLPRDRAWSIASRKFADLLLDLVEDRVRRSLQSKPTRAAFSCSFSARVRAGRATGTPSRKPLP